MTHVEKRHTRQGKETIHSGHFMVSHFEAEAQDEFDDLAVPVPDEEQNIQKVSVVATYTVPGSVDVYTPDKQETKQHQQLSIEISLTKLFRCMTLAYRQKLTSPKWNRFKGIKLRWKDKIRLNNVIWRCWHMQFIKKQNTLVCQFASPLDVDTHVKPETTILEGKYWKRRAEAVIAEYKKWRMFHIMRLLGKGDSSVRDTTLDMETAETFSQCDDLAGNMLTDEDYLSFMSDTLFSTITNHQPFAFPDPREIARGASLADFIQPSLGPLQPNLEDFMDTLEPLHDLLSTPRLPSVPEETAISTEDSLYRSGMPLESYSSIGEGHYITGSHSSTAVTMPTSQMSIHGTNSNTQMMTMSDQNVKNEHIQLYDSRRMLTTTDMSNSIITSQEMLQSFPPTYDQQTPAHSEAQMHSHMYPGKSRLQYVNTSKMVTHPDTSYNKYNNTAIPPSQTAPETVSLLQQPVQNTKYTSTIVMQSRSVPSYSRDKGRPRMNVYTGQPTNSQFESGYGQTMHGHMRHQTPSYETHPPPRHASPQMQYLQPSTVDSYKPKSIPNSVNPRSFKMPSPPLPAQQMLGSSSTESNRGARSNKEQFRSHSLPLGAQLNPNWTVSVSGAATATPSVPVTGSATEPVRVPHVPRSPTSPAHDASVPRLTARAREQNLGPLRIRSRSSSSGVLVDGATGSDSSAAGSSSGVSHRPPPLTSVGSDSALPKASVMLAQLLSTQHSQSLYKLSNSAEEGGVGSDPTRSPAKLGQPSPIGSDVMSPHHSLSPPASPPSPQSDSAREPRRTHMHAEQKRRYNIKNGFDTLQALIPQLNANPAAKISKAAMLQKGAEYIKQLKAERQQIKEDMESLRQQIECLNNSISNCHSLLPATGAPVSRARAGRLREMFARHVANRTGHNWKYWLFSVVAAALVESFSACVSCGSGADLVRTTLLWAEQHCSLVEMRPAVLSSLRVLCTTTDILTNPERLPEEARAAAVTSAGVKPEPT